MSPASTTVAAPPVTSTCTSSAVVISVSFQVHHKPRGVVGLIPGHLQLVHHVPDQEEPPPARRLLARELRLEVGLGRPAPRPRATLVGHVDPHRSRLADDADLDGKLCTKLVSVLH